MNFKWDRVLFLWVLATLLLASFQIWTGNAMELGVAQTLRMLITQATVALVFVAFAQYVITRLSMSNAQKALRQLNQVFDNGLQGVIVTVTDVKADALYPNLIYLIGNHKIVLSDAQKVKDENLFEVFEFHELPPLMLAAIAKDAEYITSGDRVFANFAGESRFGQLHLLHIKVKAEDAAVFDIHPVHQDNRTRVRRYIRKQHGDRVGGVRITIVEQPEDKIYPDIIYPFERDAIVLDDSDNVQTASFDWMNDTILRSLLGNTDPRIKMVGIVTFAGAELLTIEIAAKDADKLDIESEPVPYLVLFQKKLPPVHGEISGLLIEVTEQDKKIFLPKTATWSEEIDDALEEWSVEFETMDPNDLDPTIADAVLGGGSDIVTLAGVIEPVPGIKLLKVTLTEEDALELDLAYDDAPYSLVIERRIQAEHGLDVQGVMVRITDQVITLDYIPMIAGFGDAAVKAAKAYAKDTEVEIFDLDEEYEILCQAIAGDDYTEPITVAGVEEITPGFKVLVIEVTAEDMYDVFEIEGTEPDQHVIIERAVKGWAEDDTVHGFMIKVTDAPRDQKFTNEIYFFRGQEPDEASLESMPGKVYDIVDNMDDDLAMELTEDENAENYLTVEGIEEHGGRKLLVLTIDAENAESYSISPEETPMGEQLQGYVTEEFGKLVSGVMVEIVNPDDGDEYPIVVYMFSADDRKLVEQAGIELEFEDPDNFDSDLAAVLFEDESNSNVDVDGVTDVGDAKLLRITIEASEALYFGF